MSEQVFRMETGNIHDAYVSACVDHDSIWVELRLGACEVDMAPEVARKLASYLEAAANAADNISKRDFTSILTKGEKHEGH